MKHLVEDFGTTAFLTTLVILGSFIILFKISSRLDPSALLTLVGSWVSAIVSAIAVIKSAKKPNP